MRMINNPPLDADAAVVAVPPGAYVAKFYHHDELTLSTSGVDVHLTGARLVRLVGLLDAASESGAVVVSVKKNGVEFYQLEIAEGETRAIEELPSVLESMAMDFRGLADRLSVEIIDTGLAAASLTVLGVFDR